VINDANAQLARSKDVSRRALELTDRIGLDTASPQVRAWAERLRNQIESLPDRLEPPKDATG
jgi:hypothetical protein